MKKTLAIMLSAAVLVSLAACGGAAPPAASSSAPAESAPTASSSTPAESAPAESAPAEAAPAPEAAPMGSYPNGTYRGAFFNPEDVEIEFVLQDGKFSEVKFRQLGYKGEDYLKSEDAAMKGIVGQYQALADHLVGKDPSAVQDLYKPENIAQDTDAFTSATLRSAKMISALNNGLERGIYKLPDPAPTAQEVFSKTYIDGTYRGAFMNPEDVEIQMVMKDGKFAEVKFRQLGYKGEDYLKSEDAAMKGIVGQYQALADYLVGKDVTAVYDLYTPANIAQDTDAFTSATLRSAKMISAIVNGLDRGLYTLPDPAPTAAEVFTKTYGDGTYRGAFFNPEDVEIQFVLKDGKFTEVKFRQLGYKGQDYLKSEDAAMKGITGQYQQLADHLVGKDITAVYDLYMPGNVATDTDAFTSATLRSSKMISAIVDGLNRGLYMLPEA